VKYTKVVELVNEILEQYDEATVRQVYYRLVSPPYQYVENVRSMYSSFDSMLTRAREEGSVNWRKIVDHTRQTISPDEVYYDDPVAYLQSRKQSIQYWSMWYNVDFWENQPYMVRVFVEKDALSHIVADEALKYHVSVVPGRGYNSLSQLMGEAEQFKKVDKSIICLYFGDFDPTGLDIDRSAGDRLVKYSQADFKLVRVALTEDDVATLPSNPTKAADSRAATYVARYGNQCWELDALPPNQLRDRVRQSIENYIDAEQWREDEERQKRDREYIREAINNWQR
jgi:hypothetical protein